MGRTGNRVLGSYWQSMKQLQEHYLALKDEEPHMESADDTPDVATAASASAYIDVEQFARTRGFVTAAERRRRNAEAAGVPVHGATIATPIRGVSIGGWLCVERWMTPSLWRDVPDPDLTDGAFLRFQSTVTKQWLSAQMGGGPLGSLSVAVPGIWETFRVWRFGNRKMALRATDDNFVRAEGGWVTTYAEAVEESAVFEMQRCPADENRVHLVASDGSYLEVAGPGASVSAVSTADPGWADGPATFRLAAEAMMQGEYQLSNGLGPERAKEVLQKHWAEFVTEADFQFMAEHGVNSVRIPVGWWTAKDEPAAPWVGGGYKYLDKALDWCSKHGLLLLIDLHAAPGCQNSWDNGGSRDGSCQFGAAGTTYVQDTLDVIEFFCARYASHKAFQGIQFLNEPSIHIRKEVLEQFYADGYDVVRRHSPDAFVCFSTYIDGPSWATAGIMADSRYRNVLLDGGHWYSAYTRTGMSPAWYGEFVNRFFMKQLQNLLKSNPNLPIVIGEWSVGLQNTAAPPTDLEYRMFGAVEVAAWANATGGWYFFTLKVEGDNLDSFSFVESVKRGWLDPELWLNPKKLMPLKPAKWRPWKPAADSQA